MVSTIAGRSCRAGIALARARPTACALIPSSTDRAAGVSNSAKRRRQRSRRGRYGWRNIARVLSSAAPQPSSHAAATCKSSLPGSEEERVASRQPRSGGMNTGMWATKRTPRVLNRAEQASNAEVITIGFLSATCRMSAGMVLSKGSGMKDPQSRANKSKASNAARVDPGMPGAAMSEAVKLTICSSSSLGKFAAGRPTARAEVLRCRRACRRTTAKFCRVGSVCARSSAMGCKNAAGMSKLRARRDSCAWRRTADHIAACGAESAAPSPVLRLLSSDASTSDEKSSWAAVRTSAVSSSGFGPAARLARCPWRSRCSRTNASVATLSACASRTPGLTIDATGAAAGYLSSPGRIGLQRMSWAQTCKRTWRGAVPHKL
eukprot:scaffold163253_cov31-Tisochrysis_lutea.AAC.3